VHQRPQQGPKPNKPLLPHGQRRLVSDNERLSWVDLGDRATAEALISSTSTGTSTGTAIATIATAVIVISDGWLERRPHRARCVVEDSGCQHVRLPPSNPPSIGRQLQKGHPRRMHRRLVDQVHSFGEKARPRRIVPPGQLLDHTPQASLQLTRKSPQLKGAHVERPVQQHAAHRTRRRTSQVARVFARKKSRPDRLGPRNGLA